MTWALVALAAFLVILDNAASRRWQKKSHSVWTRWYGSPRYRLINYLVALAMVTFFIDIYARTKAKDIYAGNGRIVDVQLVDSDTKRSAVLLDTTAQFVFLFDATTKRVSIHPNENIEEISFVAPR